jgi:hypothetical protein
LNVTTSDLYEWCRMNKQQIALKLVLDELGLSIRVASFHERLAIQKGCYLAQAGDVNLGYYFSWYLRGPYCSSLARDAFAVSDELDSNTDESAEWKLDEQTISRLAKVRALITESPMTDLPRKLELLASVHFLVTRKSLAPDDPVGLTMALRRFGKEFAKSEVAAATQGLAKHGLIPN